jgi:hypothetical protein
MVAFYVTVVACVAVRALPWPALISLLAVTKLVPSWKALSQPRPDEPPARFPVWPLWFAAIAFVHTRRAGSLLVLGLVIAAAANPLTAEATPEPTPVHHGQPGHASDRPADPAATGHRRPAVAPASTAASGTPAAEALRPLIGHSSAGRIPVRFEFWDGSVLEPSESRPTVPAVVRVQSVDAVRRILWAPGEIGLARAFVAGDIEIDGDIFATLRALSEVSARDLARLGVRALPAA